MAVRYLGPNADRMETALKQGGWRPPPTRPPGPISTDFQRDIVLAPTLGRDVPSSCQIMSTTLLGTGRERESV